jgi:hypothetical protein
MSGKAQPEPAQRSAVERKEINVNAFHLKMAKDTNGFRTRLSLFQIVGTGERVQGLGPHQVTELGHNLVESSGRVAFPCDKPPHVG